MNPENCALFLVKLSTAFASFLRFLNQGEFFTLFASAALTVIYEFITRFTLFS